ncbi:MAG: DUF4139 domain-containing protein, partial [Chloroflexi bacterium]|nr:DUF4139 domain-containing protein [Chloroflexota bacterium]
MMKRVVSGFLIVTMLIAFLLILSGQTVSAGPQTSAGGIVYASLPDEAALYLNDIVFVRDTVTLPGEDVRVLLPPGMFPGTLILTEDGARVRNYRLSGQSADVYFSQAAYNYGGSSYGVGGISYILTWTPNTAAAESREIKLEYLMSGAYWTPNYDMRIESESSVNLAFFAEIYDSGLMLEEATVYLMAARVDLSQQIDQVSQMTFNQVAVGYEQTGVSLPDLGVGTIDLQHIYPAGLVSAQPGDTVYLNLADSTLKARRLHVWNAREDQQVGVIYKVTNDTEVPFAEGIVRTYQDGLFMGSDFIEKTPIGSEGSVTVGHLPDVRVSRSESQEYNGDAIRDYYLYSVTLDIENFGQEDVDLIVLDAWLQQAWDFEFSREPVRQPDNLLRWEIKVAAGEKITITYK